MENQPRLKAVKSDGSVIWLHQISATTNQLTPGSTPFPMRLLPIASSPYRKTVPTSSMAQTPMFGGQHGPTIPPSRAMTTKLVTTRLPGHSLATCLRLEKPTCPGQQPIRSQIVSQISQNVRLANQTVFAAHPSQDSPSTVKQPELIEPSGQNQASYKNPVFIGSYPPPTHDTHSILREKSSETSRPFTPPDLNLSANLLEAAASGDTVKDSVVSSPSFIYSHPVDEQLPGIKRLRSIF